MAQCGAAEHRRRRSGTSPPSAASVASVAKPAGGRDGQLSNWRHRRPAVGLGWVPVACGQGASASLWPPPRRVDVVCGVGLRALLRDHPRPQACCPDHTATRVHAWLSWPLPKGWRLGADRWALKGRWPARPLGGFDPCNHPTPSRLGRRAAAPRNTAGATTVSATDTTRGLESIRAARRRRTCSGTLIMINGQRL